MASRGHEYMLVGFSEEVDRRPLIFVEALPATRLCGACGVVPKVIALLECEHFFCKPCYEQCQRNGEVVCPLDGEACLKEEVSWMNHSDRSVMAKKVLCWNQSNGCTVVMSAGYISKHFHHECGHHLARCPKCGAGILASHVCAHLESRCDAARVSSAAAVQQTQTVSQEQEPLGATCSELSIGFQGIYSAISKAMSSIQAELKEISRALKVGVAATTSRHGEAGERSLEAGILQESLSQMKIHTAQLKDQLDEFMHNVNANQQTFHNSFVEKNEALKQSLTHAVQSTITETELATQFAAFRAATEDRHRETKGQLDRLSLAIDRQYDRMTELLRNTNTGVQRLTRNSQDTAEAHAESFAQNVSEIAWAKFNCAEDRQNALAVLPSILPVAITHTWTFEEWRSLEQAPVLELEIGLKGRMGDPVYLRGYCVSVGISISFLKAGSVTLLFQLYRGKIDQYLEWPFNFEVRCSILHPDGTEIRTHCVTPRKWPHCIECFSRPKEVRGNMIFGIPCSTTEELEKWGFVKDGRILVSLALDPIGDDQP